VTDADALLFAASLQVTVIVFEPTTSGWLLPDGLSHVGAAPELSVAVYVSVVLAAAVDELFAGAVIVITGAVVSGGALRVTVTEADEVLFAASWQETVIVFDPSESGWLEPDALSQIGAAPELSVAV
jgi:hypothetical protein